MAKSTKTKTKTSTGAGERRAQHFANGGSIHEWRGGLATRIPSGKTYKRRAKHRGDE